MNAILKRLGVKTSWRAVKINQLKQLVGSVATFINKKIRTQMFTVHNKLPHWVPHLSALFLIFAKSLVNYYMTSYLHEFAAISFRQIR